MSSFAEAETRTISAAEFKAKCLQLMDEVNEKKLTLIITKRGKPVMEASAPKEDEKPFIPLWGRSPSVKILGDIVSPLPQEWTLPEFAWERSPNENATKPRVKTKKSKNKA